MAIPIEELLETLKKLRSIDQQFPVQYAICLLEISRNEGCSLTELADIMETPLSSLSRIVGALSNHRQSGTPYELVSVTASPTERRRNIISLTSQGRDFVANLTT
jgi:DNA-binding MarR family transcriptional regulator